METVTLRCVVSYILMKITVLVVIPLIGWDLYRTGLPEQTFVADGEVYGLLGCIERSVMVVPVFFTCQPRLLLLMEVLF